MNNTATNIVALEKPRIVGHVQLDPRTVATPPPARPSSAPAADGFLAELVGTGFAPDALRREHGRIVGEILALQADNRWQDIIDLFSPVEDKLPDLVAAGMDTDIRLKIAFALVRGRRSEEAIRLLTPVVRREPDNALAHYNLAYAALDELYSARTEHRIIPGKRRQELIRLGHEHFGAARALRPDSVTFAYREAILCKEIENKPRPAIPLFEQAIAIWQGLDASEQARRHQERPKYVKSLYHLASCLLAAGRAADSLRRLHTLEAEDGERCFMHPLFRHFAFGKVLHALGRYKEALDRLETAAHAADPHQPTDFVWELAARCALRLGQVDRAQACIERVPRNRRRPYVQWTEADVLAARGRVNEALQVLRASAERDRRSPHVSLIRMARLLLGRRELEEALDAATRAVRFCEETWGNASREGRFWQAAALHLLGRNGEAVAIVTELEEAHFQYPHFGRLAGLVRAALATGSSRVEAGQAGGKNATGEHDHDAAAVNQ